MFFQENGNVKKEETKIKRMNEALLKLGGKVKL